MLPALRRRLLHWTIFAQLNGNPAKATVHAATLPHTSGRPCRRLSPSPDRHVSTAPARELSIERRGLDSRVVPAQQDADVATLTRENARGVFGLEGHVVAECPRFGNADARSWKVRAKFAVMHQVSDPDSA